MLISLVQSSNNSAEVIYKKVFNKYNSIYNLPPSYDYGTGY